MSSKPVDEVYAIDMKKKKVFIGDLIFVEDDRRLGGQNLLWLGRVDGFYKHELGVTYKYVARGNKEKWFAERPTGSTKKFTKVPDEYGLKDFPDEWLTEMFKDQKFYVEEDFNLNKLHS